MPLFEDGAIVAGCCEGSHHANRGGICTTARSGCEAWLEGNSCNEWRAIGRLGRWDEESDEHGVGAPASRLVAVTLRSAAMEGRIETCEWANSYTLDALTSAHVLTLASVAVACRQWSREGKRGEGLTVWGVSTVPAGQPLTVTLLTGAKHCAEVIGLSTANGLTDTMGQHTPH